MANRKDVALLKQGSGRLEPLASSRALRSAQDHVLALLALGLVALIDVGAWIRQPIDNTKVYEIGGIA
jgi:hypothetical protein